MKTFQRGDVDEFGTLVKVRISLLNSEVILSGIRDGKNYIFNSASMNLFFNIKFDMVPQGWMKDRFQIHTE